MYSLSGGYFFSEGLCWANKTKNPWRRFGQLKKIFELSGTPNIIASDNGSEWKGVVANFLKEKNIVHRTNEVGDHHVLGVIDRLAKTIKNKIYQNFTAENNTKWLVPLKEIISTYNDTPHSRLDNMSPNEAEKYIGYKTDTLQKS